MMPELKTILWFASQDGKNSPYSTALNHLNSDGAEIKLYRGNNLSYHEGTLTRSNGTLANIFLIPLSGKYQEFTYSVAKTANLILFSGTCCGRRGRVKIGDIIGLTRSYLINSVSTSSLSAAREAISVLTSLKDAKLEHPNAPNISIETRRDWVLDYLNNANKAVPLKELFRIASDEKADTATRNKQWQQTVRWLQQESFISSENTQTEITEKGRNYCNSNTLEAFAEQSPICTLHLGTIMNSPYIRNDLQSIDAWNKFDEPMLPPILGLDNDTYDLLKTYPQLIVIKAVKNFNGDEDDETNTIQKVSTTAVMHIIKNL